jgi:ribosomal protein S18 acetylase RimI-like enzyme
MQKPDGEKEAFRALRLRPATPEDEPFLLQLFATTRSDELAALNLDEKQKEAFIAMQFRAQSRQFVMSYPRAQNSIVMWSEAPIGRLLLDRGEREFTLVDVALLPIHRGAGIGNHLLEQILAEAAEAGKPVRLSVWHSNPAKRLYERLGFSVANDDGMYCQMSWQPTANSFMNHSHNH